MKHCREKIGNSKPLGLWEGNGPAARGASDALCSAHLLGFSGLMHGEKVEAAEKILGLSSPMVTAGLHYPECQCGRWRQGRAVLFGDAIMTLHLFNWFAFCEAETGSPTTKGALISWSSCLHFLKTGVIDMSHCSQFLLASFLFL